MASYCILFLIALFDSFNVSCFYHLITTSLTLYFANTYKLVLHFTNVVFCELCLD